MAVSWESANVGQFCAPGGFEDLGPWLERDGVDMANFAEATLYYTQFDGVRCALPLLADAYGLYYNKALFEEAGIDGPPKTITELTDYAKKLTKRNDDGSLAVVGLRPPVRLLPELTRPGSRTMFGADWVDEEGNSSFSTDPGLGRGPDVAEGAHRLLRLRRPVTFNAGAGDEFSASNAFQDWQVAMNIDGEWRWRSSAAKRRTWTTGRHPCRWQTTSPTCTVRATSTARSWASRATPQTRSRPGRW